MWARRLVGSAGAAPRLAHTHARAPAVPLRLLRAGFAARDLEQVWDAWKTMQTQGDLHKMRRNDDADLLALVRANLAVLAPRSSGDAVQFPLRDTRAEAWRARCEEWGLHAARRADILGVQGWMKVELLCGDAPRAIALFHAYLAERRRAKGDELVYLDADLRRRRQIHDLLELVVLCYAHTNDLHSMVQVFQSFEVGTHTELFFDYGHCRRQFAKFPWTGVVQKDNPALEAVQQRALDWVSHAELARGLHGGSGAGGGHNRIARLLGSTLTRGDLVAFWRLFCAAMQAGVLGDTPTPWLVQAQLPAENALPAWTDSCWTVCVSGLLAARRTDLATQVWAALIVVQDAMKKAGHTQWPPLALWNAILDGYSRGGDYAAVQATWRVLTHADASTRDVPLAQHVAKTLARPAGLAPDLLCYTTMIAASFRKHRVDTALDLFRRLQALQASGQLAIPVETYNAVVHGLCVSSRMDDAQALVQAMGSGSVPAPTITTLNVLLRSQARVRNLGAMAETLRRIPALGLRPDVITFTTVLDALLRAADTPERAEAAVQQVMQIMDSLQVQPNSVTFTAMIKACLHTRTDEETAPRLQVALQLLHTMCTTKLAPNLVTYATLLPGVLEHGAHLAALAAQDKIPALFRRAPLGIAAAALERDLPFDKANAGVRMALVLWDLMRTASITPSMELYHVLLPHLLDARSPTAFAIGTRLADELLHANGTLAPEAATAEATAPAPSPASWALVLGGVLSAARDAECLHTRDARALLVPLLRHLHSSPHGNAALGAETRANSPSVARLAQEASALAPPVARDATGYPSQ